MAEIKEKLIKAEGLKAVYDALNTAKANKSTTLAGYGITDAATSTQGGKADSAIQTIKINNTEQTKTSGVVNLPAYPTLTSLGGIASSDKGVSNGVAPLDENGLIPTSHLPSYVDDVIEKPKKTDFPTIGEAGKIYVETDTNLTYRWSGTAYVEISPSIALGETSSTAYAGDKGKQTTDNFNTHKDDTTIHVTSTEKASWNAKYTKPSTGIPTTDLATDAKNKIENAVLFTAQTLTDAQKAIARSNIGAGSSTFSGDYNDLTNKPEIASVDDIKTYIGIS